MDDLSQFKLSTTPHVFCPRCTPHETPIAIDQCAVCEAHYCNCVKCLEWLHEYNETYELNCLCAKGAAIRIDHNKADSVIEALNLIKRNEEGIFRKV